ncbi:MAG: hypothetical protein JHC70_10785 [Rhodococcus sp.]|nr:hypothetical protein [Rhodococcus sp. (in: high G+C Gram-positive bacteria)]MBJ7322810.1 hypothetical protein [Rhodococcus sp. (in: high G+C Gram-positive bacteria)]
MATQTPFTVRMPAVDHETLTEVAKMRGIKAADLAREILMKAIPELVDEEFLQQQMDEEKKRILAVAADIRERRAAAAQKNSHVD